MSDISLPRSLVYGTDERPGIRRLGQARFRYVHEATGKPVSGDDRLRINSLAVPPAWTSVWIAADADSHLQATGRDARGRKQYRYHPDFTAHRGEAKFEDLAAFGRTLGGLRRAVERDLESREIEHDHVVAVLVRLLDLTYLRIGNEVYAETNKSYGLTTLRNRHVAIRGNTIRLRFTGKSAHAFDVTVEDRRLAKLIRRCHALPGQHLFQYETDDGSVRPVGSSDVNDYVRTHSSPTASAKTFRTWGASVLAGQLLAGSALRDEPRTAQTVNTALREVAGRLGNTLAVCRSSYVHPTITEQFLDGSLAERWSGEIARTPRGLTADERRLLQVISPAK